MVNLYIRTRGFKTDYSFLLEQQARIPDSNYYKSDIQKPTCILERTQENLGYLFLSGIPSQRKDHQGTPIRYELVAAIDSDPLDGSWENDSSEENYLMGLTRLISIWLNEVKDALQEIEEGEEESWRVRSPLARESELGSLLDRTLPEKYVEELLQLTVANNWTQDNKKELDNKIKGLLLQIPEQSVLSGQKLDAQSWWGGLKEKRNWNQWIELIEKLLKGETKGKALLLNIATPQSLSRLSVKKDEELGVLLAKEWAKSELESIKPQDDSDHNSEIPQGLENLLSDSRIPQGTKESMRKLWKDGVRQRKELFKNFFLARSD